MKENVKLVFKKNKDSRFLTLKKAVSATAETIEIPRYHDGKYVAEIGACAFKKCPSIKTVVIPDTVTVIANRAFAACDIKSLVVPSTVTRIGDKAFADCVYLKDIEIESASTELGKNLFVGCYHIKKVTEPVSAFVGRWFTSAEEITVTGGGAIAENLFKDCDRLKKIVIGDGITEIGENAFCDCSALTEIVLPDCLKVIDSYAFKGCVSLKEFTVPKGVEEIYWEAFSGCALERLTVDKENTVFKSDGDCIINIAQKKLVAGCADSIIPKDGSVTAIDDGAFRDCVGLQAIVIPESIKCIGDNAFGGCVDLESIVLSEGVEEISDFAFVECSHLESVNLPSTLKKLGFGVFDECEWLSDVFYNGTVAEWNELEKDYDAACNSSFVLHCTDGDSDDYK